MALIIVGTILLLSPFLLLTRFKDKQLGFATLFSFVIALQLLTAIITQALNVFNYLVILTVNLTVFLAVATTFLKNVFHEKVTLPKIDWVLLLVLVISSICLFSVHYNYSGKYTIAATTDYQKAERMRYPYPYYADEWYAVSFIKDAIASHSLPLRNPLAPPAWSKKFINLEFVSHSFLANIMLLLHLDPLINYSYLSISSGVVICLLLYLFLRHSEIHKLPAAITSLSVLYLTNGANLPGLWYLIPVNLGIISFLLSIFFFSVDNKKMLLLLTIITLLFYPPFVVFYSVAMLVFLFNKKEVRVSKLKIILYYLLLVLFVAVIISFGYFFSQDTQSTIFHYVFSKIFYSTFTPNTIPQYLLYTIIPIPILLLSVLGTVYLLRTRKKDWLLSMVFLGLMYWVLYSYVLFRFIIEWQRVIVFTSILITIIAGFGLQEFITFLKNTGSFRKNDILHYAQIGIVFLFFVFSFNYTSRDSWQNLQLVNVENNNIFIPAGPANTYLQPGDLKLFKAIKKQNFLSLPWKGTVMGVATDNYPFSTKPGTISIAIDLSSRFVHADCREKDKIAHYHGLVYVYFPKFDCPNFKQVGVSSEELHLYKFIDPLHK